jgi:hypothetical protein
MTRQICVSEREGREYDRVTSQAAFSWDGEIFTVEYRFEDHDEWTHSRHFSEILLD